MEFNPSFILGFKFVSIACTSFDYGTLMYVHLGSFHVDFMAIACSIALHCEFNCMSFFLLHGLFSSSDLLDFGPFIYMLSSPAHVHSIFIACSRRTRTQHSMNLHYMFTYLGHVFLQSVIKAWSIICLFMIAQDSRLMLWLLGTSYVFAW